MTRIRFYFFRLCPEEITAIDKGRMWRREFQAVQNSRLLRLRFVSLWRIQICFVQFCLQMAPFEPSLVSSKGACPISGRLANAGR